LIGVLLRYPYEVRDSADYFDDIQDVKITKDMTATKPAKKVAAACKAV
jgi:non-homologous end joining protein Ku